jgi:hypothetical protein
LIQVRIYEEYYNKPFKGVDPNDISCQFALRKGVKGDKPAQYIGKKLGGGGTTWNVFPLNEQVSYITLF